MNRIVAPVKVLQLELSDGVPRLTRCGGYRAARALVRRRGRPVGWISVPHDGSDEIPPRRVAAALRMQLALPYQGDPEGDTPAVATPAPPRPISVVVATRDRPEELRRCLTAILASRYPASEIVVVDNRSATTDSADVAAGFPVRYVREDRPGWGRNRGIAEATHDIIAFTDDDAWPDPDWLGAIAAALANPRTALVTGLVAPAELDTPAQVCFELDCGGMGRGFEPRTYSRDRMTTADRVRIQSVGVGANMAFRRSVFESVGGFNPALGPGTPARAGEDLEMFHRVIEAGFEVRYEPWALVWHVHRRDMPALRAQLYDTGRGYGAYLLAIRRSSGIGSKAVLEHGAIPWGAWLLGRFVKRAVGLHRRPFPILWAELRGALDAVRGRVAGPRSIAETHGGVAGRPHP